ncbi:GntR family transcriptional regulator [Kitasatospora sp. NPDC004272]
MNTERGPGYADIAGHYRQLISDGALQPGDALPSLREVCEQFSVSITTANRAFGLLKAEGLTIARPGVGTVVASRQTAVSTGAARIDRLERTGKEYQPGETSTGHRAVRIHCSDPSIAELLEIDLDDEVVMRYRVFTKNGTPTSVGYSYIHIRALESVPEVLQQGSLKPFWHKTYKERTGLDISRSPERRTARIATPDELAVLEAGLPSQAVAAAVLVTRTTFHDEHGPIEVWEDIWAPGHWQEDGQ